MVRPRHRWCSRAQLTGLPSRWRVSSVYYLPGAGVLRVSRYALGTGNPDLGADGGLEYQTNLPYLMIDPATRKNSCYLYPNRKNFSKKSIVETINGHRVVLTQRILGTLLGQDLCAAHADGLALFISQFGAHPPSAWPACSETTCGCSAPTRRTGPQDPSCEQDRRPRTGAGSHVGWHIKPAVQCGR
jgi:hypothetical protein